jgi:hypothetical protein
MFNLVLGGAIRKFLDRYVGSKLGRKILGFRVACLLSKLKASCPSRSLSETSPELWACLMGYGTEQHSDVTVHVIFLITFLYFLPPINIKTFSLFSLFISHQ